MLVGFAGHFEKCPFGMSINLVDVTNQYHLFVFFYIGFSPQVIKRNLKGQFGQNENWREAL